MTNIHELSAPEVELQLRARTVADDLLPTTREADRVGGFSDEWQQIQKRLHDEGYLTMYLPPEDGGWAASITDLVLVQEQFARHDGGFANVISHEACASTMLQFAQREVRDHYIERMVAGELTAICISEPTVGTDIANMGARAAREGYGYRLSGDKRYISLGAAADILLFFALTDPKAGLRGGISAFVVDRHQDGIDIQPPEDTLGFRLLPHSDMTVRNVTVPETARLGDEGEGLRIFGEGLNLGRLGGGTQAMGLAVGAYERALAFARERETMGRPIIKHQAIGFKLAQMEVDVEAMRSLTYATARWLDRTGDIGSRDASMKVAVAKTHNTDVALRVCGEAVQIFGAQGIWRSNDVERLFRDAKVSQLVDGPNELMRLRIANTLARG
ncbi:acyl-CoA dehydrogenase family protein [Nitriliruptor alkaliphilus]|uniref:acyl-CoA dehydrogenase family protein n=1 Tax=Nitriliruptor alkaliphilus TaxID=427918 RepID=UPI0006985FCF|nr:acyl-CoA dehydrogenase family protein [Nitriliruptor alkaliphilus]